VIETISKNNQVVSPYLDKIVIKFSSPMKNDSYSFVIAGEGETPVIIGKPVFEDKYTCLIHVKLKPNTIYSLGINSKTRKGFVSEDGIPAEPFVLTFKTSEQIDEKISEKAKTIIYSFYFDKTQGAFWLLVPKG
jgi:hypothetical protein